jgi:hypothetical protein
MESTEMVDPIAAGQLDHGEAVIAGERQFPAALRASAAACLRT